MAKKIMGGALAALLFGLILVMGQGPDVRAGDPPAVFQDGRSFTDGWVRTVFADRDRPVSAFNHDQHTGYPMASDCSVCHHLYKDGKKVDGESSEDQACSSCHKEQAQGNQPRILSAYHNLCKKCHETEKKGPLTCGECHTRG
jgi:cytochrome c2